MLSHIVLLITLLHRMFDGSDALLAFIFILIAGITAKPITKDLSSTVMSTRQAPQTTKMTKPLRPSSSKPLLISSHRISTLSFSKQPSSTVKSSVIQSAKHTAKTSISGYSSRISIHYSKPNTLLSPTQITHSTQKSKSDFSHKKGSQIADSFGPRSEEILELPMSVKVVEICIIGTITMIGIGMSVCLCHRAYGLFFSRRDDDEEDANKAKWSKKKRPLPRKRPTLL